MVKVVRDALSSQLANREQALTGSSSSGVSSSSQEKRDQFASGAKTAKLLFANKTEKDILWKEELLQFGKSTKGR